MPLSAEEIAIAKKAYSEMRTCDNSRTLFTLTLGLFLFFVLLFGVFFACGMIVEDHGKTLKGWAAFLSFLSSFQALWPLFLISLSQVFTYRRLKPRYAKNLKVVTEMEQHHAGELPFGLEEET